MSMRLGRIIVLFLLIHTAAFGADETVVLTFTNAPVAEILQKYQHLSGKSIIRYPGVPNVLVTLNSEPEVKKEALLLIESALSANHCYLVERDEKTLYLVAPDAPAKCSILCSPGPSVISMVPISRLGRSMF